MPDRNSQHAERLLLVYATDSRRSSSERWRRSFSSWFSNVCIRAFRALFSESKCCIARRLSAVFSCDGLSERRSVMLRTRSAAACGAVLRHWNSAAAIDTKKLNARWTRMMTTSLEYIYRRTEKQKSALRKNRARSENCVISHKPQVSGGVNRLNLSATPQLSPWLDSSTLEDDDDAPRRSSPCAKPLHTWTHTLARLVPLFHTRSIMRYRERLASATREGLPPTSVRRGHTVQRTCRFTPPGPRRAS